VGGTLPTSRRPVRDRWFYLPATSEKTSNQIADSSDDEVDLSSSSNFDILTDAQRTQMIRRFNVEGRNRRSVLKAHVQRVWDARTRPSMGSEVASVGEDSLDGTLNRELNQFLSQRLDNGGILDPRIALDEFREKQLEVFDQNRQENKLLFLDEIRGDSGHAGDSGSSARDPASDYLLQQRTIALWAGLRRVYFHEAEAVASNGEDSPYGVSPNGEDSTRLPANGEGLAHLAGYLNPFSASPNGEDSARVSENGEDSPFRTARVSDNGEDSPLRARFNIEQAYFGSEMGIPAGDDASDENDDVEMDEVDDVEIPGFSRYHDKYEAAVALQPLPESRGGASEIPSPQKKPKETLRSYVSRKIMLSVKTIRRILACKETIHKYGVFVPRNDREADSSPEAARWASGRQLEWIRLQEQGTFERNWDWVRLHKAYPNYQKSDVGHVFYVYDHKHSGEHRVRLVFAAPGKIRRCTPRPMPLQLGGNQFDSSTFSRWRRLGR
jgi:hypothetical protein